jgi:hypothetical protein
MTDLLTDFYSEFGPVAMNALGIPTPAFGTLNMLTTIQGQQHNFNEMLNGREGAGWKFVPPGIIISCGDFVEKADELSLNSSVLARMPITIIYVQDLGNVSTQSYMYNKINSLKKIIEARPDTFNTFSRIEQGKILTSVDCPINSSLMANSQLSIICSALTYIPGFLVQLY